MLMSEPLKCNKSVTLLKHIACVSEFNLIKREITVKESIYDTEDALQDTPQEVSTTVANKVINLLNKRKPVVLFILGTYEWAEPIETFEYSTDRDLLLWVKAVIDKGCVILASTDNKFGQATEVCEKLHFEAFLIEGVPNHEMTGLAINMTHHMSVVNHADVEHISNFVGITSVRDDEEEMSDEEARRHALLSEE